MGRGGRRAGAGRKPKSPELRVLTGTQRDDRQVAVGEPAPEGAMICPLHLSDLAQLHFRSIALMLEEQKRASPHYAEHVALLAQRLEQIQRFQAVLESAGDTYETTNAQGSTMIRARPEVAMLADAMRHAQSLLGEPMRLPTRRDFDPPLVLGSLAFGVGWGLAGFCPGPALVATGAGVGGALVFTLAMLAGMGLFELKGLLDRGRGR